MSTSVDVWASDENSDFVRRAIAAWFRAGGTDYPANSSSLEKLGGKYYVVLENTNGVLAVYRVTNQDRLKRLRRWPQELEKR